jgi:hypothetical protein
VDPDRAGPRRLTVVTGAPCAGLTSFLDAIALGAARLGIGGQRPDAAEVIRAGGQSATIRQTYRLDAAERAFGGVTEEILAAEIVFQREGLGRADADPALLGLMSRYDHTPDTSKVVLVPARRVVDGGPAMGQFESEQRFKHLSSDPTKLGGIPAALAKHTSGFGDRDRFDTTARLFAELTGSTQLVGADPSGLSFSVAGGRRIPLSRLGFSERNALVLAALVVLCGLGRSLVLLDTPEMGLAPGVAARWVDALCAATPEAQWIVATRDPALVASVPPAALVTLSRTASEAP